jgi:hypothetical protein
VRATVAGFPLLLNASVPLKTPTVVGLHSTLTLQVRPPPNEPSQVSADLMNGGEVTMLVNVIAVFPELVAITVCVELVVPTTTLPKATLLGTSASFA